MRIDLPGGHHAVLRDPSEVTERQRRPIHRATRGIRPEILERGRAVMGMNDGPDGKPTPEKQAASLQLQYDMTNDEADAFTEAGDYTAVALVAAWSFPQDVTIDGLLDLPGHAIDALRKAVEPFAGKMNLDTTADPNRVAPGGGSNGSATPSVEVSQTTSLTSGAPSPSSASA